MNDHQPTRLQSPAWRRALRIWPHLLLLLTITLTLIAMEQPLYAASITVNTTHMAVANDGRCSLIEAIIAAETDSASGSKSGECPAGHGADIIVLTPSTYTLTAVYTDKVGSFFIGPTGLPPILSAITIEGNGATIRRASNAPEFRILVFGGATGRLTLNNLTIRGGYTSGEETGPAIWGGGDGVLTLNNVAIKDNISHHTSNPRPVDGSINVGPLTLIMNNSSVTGNTGAHGMGLLLSEVKAVFTNSIIASNNDVGVSAYGSDITFIGGAVRDNAFVGVEAAKSRVRMEGVRVSANRDGGLDISQSTLTMINSQVVDNVVRKDFGNLAAGIAIRSNSAVTLTQSSVTGNREFNYPSSTEASGGVIGEDGIKVIDSALTLIRSLVTDDLTQDNVDLALAFYGTDLVIDNSTVSGSATSQIYLGDAESVSIYHSTIVSSDDDPIALYNIGVDHQVVKISNSIVESCGEYVTSLGYNMTSSKWCGFKATGDVLDTNLDGYLGPLQDNSGITHTHALLSGPAVNAIPPHVNGCDPGQSRDQRGYLRAGGTGKGDDSCDMGAYEASSARGSGARTHLPLMMKR
ncbi:MAG: hypothetical protein GXP39_09520 [Chloroflexi bacterium]|nr:hypothetical protein [Chloroflexota bacterium]